MRQAITANRLSDGHVVYLDAQNRWSEDFRHALVVEDAAAAKAALGHAEASAQANEVVEPYAIDLDMRAGHLAPKTLRERIRAEGPTIAVVAARG